MSAYVLAAARVVGHRKARQMHCQLANHPVRVLAVHVTVSYKPSSLEDATVRGITSQRFLGLHVVAGVDSHPLRIHSQEDGCSALARVTTAPTLLH